MSIPKFMKHITSALFKDTTKEKKRASLITMINNLERKKEALSHPSAAIKEHEREEELRILSVLIEKGNRQLANLS